MPNFGYFPQFSADSGQMSTINPDFSNCRHLSEAFQPFRKINVYTSTIKAEIGPKSPRSGAGKGPAVCGSIPQRERSGS